MKTKLTKPPSHPHPSQGTGRIYAYERVLDWFSLDPSSPYRGWDGAKKMAQELYNDFSDDGKIGLGKHGTPTRGEVTYSFVPSAPRVHVTPDSVITYASVPVLGGSIERRNAEPRD